MANYYDNMVRVAIMVTTGGKRIYMLVKDAARKCAYDAVAHKGLNAKGEFKALIYRNDSMGKIYEGELQNHVDDTRIWYPETYFSGKSKYRKYTVRKDGSLGKGMW